MAETRIITSNYFNLFFFFLSLLFLNACSNSAIEEVENVSLSFEELYKEQSHKDAIKTEIAQMLVDSNQYYHQWLDTLHHFYQSRSYKPVWLGLCKDSAALANWKSFINEEVWHEGLFPHWYQVDSIVARLQRTLPLDEPNYSELAQLDLLISLYMLEVHKDHVIGRSSGRAALASNYRLPITKRELDWFKILNAKKYRKVFTKTALQDPEYLKLKDLLKLERAKWSQVQSDSFWEPLYYNAELKLRPGDTTSVLPEYKKRIQQIGFMDSLLPEGVDSSHYKGSMVKMMKNFQSFFNLTPDGVIGTKTMNILNRKPMDWYEEIAINMERVRWFSIPNEGKKVVVNLVDYTLIMDYEDSIKEMKVCIGKSGKADYLPTASSESRDTLWKNSMSRMQTPQIASKFSYLVVNPTWTVPKSIIKNEMWWRIRRDPSYLTRSGYGVFKGKEELDPEIINWAKLDPYKLPFRIVQGKGERNALGMVKYIFPNPFSIYLHDTPLKSKFKSTERAVSHGCVRLGEPILLAELLLMDNKKLNYDDFRIKLGLMPLDKNRLEEYDPEDTTALIQPIDSTERINIENRLPIYFDYKTVFFKEGMTYYRYDTYAYNHRALSHLKAVQPKRWWE